MLSVWWYYIKKRLKNKVFNVDKTVVTKHIKNIYSELELNENSTSANYALVQKEENGKIFQYVSTKQCVAILSTVIHTIVADKIIMRKYFFSDKCNNKSWRSIYKWIIKINKEYDIINLLCINQYLENITSENKKGWYFKRRKNNELYWTNL